MSVLDIDSAPSAMDNHRPREPLRLAAGDTVCFMRSLGRYPANAGWSIEYTGIGGGSQIVWASTVNQDGVSFDINIPAATTVAYVPGDYKLEGFAFNAQTGQRFTFYTNDLVVTPNLQNAPPDLDLRTHAQKVLDSIEHTIEEMVLTDLNDSTTEEVELHRKRLEEARLMRDHYLRERENELDKEAALTRKPSRKKIRTRLLITSPANGLNQFGAGNNIGNFY